MDAFEALMAEHRGAAERLVKFRLPPGEAEDVLQEVFLTAYQRFDSLRDPSRFKPWLLQIARSRCSDYFRERGRMDAIPLDAVPEHRLSAGGARRLAGLVHETMDAMADGDRRILTLFYFHNLPQADVAAQLGIPVGTVKSRLHHARQRFRALYPYPPAAKGDPDMKKLPNIMPEYTLEWSSEPPFSVRWEEVMGWFIVPRAGEKLRWAMYDFPERIMTESVEIEAVGRAMVHGIEGVEIHSTEFNPMECNAAPGQREVHRQFIAQLTDTHCRILAESHMEDGVRCNFTFLDGESFLDNWGFGEDNCGNETDIHPKGDIVRNGSEIRSKDRTFLLDVVGRCTVTLGGRAFDTICVMDIDTYNADTVSEQFLDRSGRTVLWRRFNPDDWKFEQTGQLWSERLPENERLTINGKTYVHWYDCITDYIL